MPVIKDYEPPKPMFWRYVRLYTKVIWEIITDPIKEAFSDAFRSKEPPPYSNPMQQYLVYGRGNVPSRIGGIITEEQHEEMRKKAFPPRKKSKKDNQK